VHDGNNDWKTGELWKNEENKCQPQRHQLTASWRVAASTICMPGCKLTAAIWLPYLEEAARYLALLPTSDPNRHRGLRLFTREKLFGPHAGSHSVRAYPRWHRAAPERFSVGHRTVVFENVFPKE